MTLWCGKSAKCVSSPVGGLCPEATRVDLKNSSNEEKLVIDFCRESECVDGENMVTYCNVEREDCWNECLIWIFSSTC